MQQEQKCECCGNILDVYETEIMIPCYDDGGSLDSFDFVTDTHEVCSNPSCNDGLERDDLPF